jgi:hypothetical protein
MSHNLFTFTQITIIIKIMKKSLLTLGLGVLVSGSLFAQLPVSTTAENKNVILEEFTGIYCTFCPDGHLRAANLKAANPGDVVLINIHAGSYAAPGGSDPDYRTTFGTPIDGQAGVAGYPAGTINRRAFSQWSQGTGTAMSRGDWTAASAVILAESSYVNVALEGDVDLTANTLTVDVEMYFTGALPAGVTSVNLNVALTQNNIAGPQTGGSANPSQMLPDGRYNHQHMLRDLLTGQWGEVITTTTMGTTITRQYVYTIPAAINGIPVSAGDLEISAFVAEGQVDVVTGVSGPITYTVPAGSILADLSSAAGNTTTADYCDPNVTPEMTVTNNGTVAVSNFDVSYSLNGGTPVSQNVSASVAAGASTTITFPGATLSAGENVITYEVSTANNPNLYDLSSANNIAASGVLIQVPSATFATYFAENFEGYALGGAAISNSLTINPDGARFFVVNQGVNSSINYDIGGYGASAQSLRWNFYSIAAGIESSLLYEKVDLSGTTLNEVIFDYAHSQYQGSNDELEVRASDDCGATWTTVWQKSGADLAQGNPEQTGNWYPSASNWNTAFLNLTAFNGSAEVLLEFIGRSDFGNNLYIDNIQMNNSNNVSLKEEALNQAFNFYPNPAEDNFTLEFDLASSATVTASIIDVTGRVVLVIAQEEVLSGAKSLNTSVANLEAGAYIVQVEINGAVSQEKLIIK